MIDDCSRGINHDNIANCFEKIKSSFGCVVQSSEVTTEAGRGNNTLLFHRDN